MFRSLPRLLLFLLIVAASVGATPSVTAPSATTLQPETRAEHFLPLPANAPGSVLGSLETASGSEWFVYEAALDSCVAPRGTGKYLADNWHQGTFPNRMQSVRYHLAKHGKGRTAQQYTQDAMDFFQKNKHLGQKVTLKDGTPGIKIQTKIKIPGQKTQRIGGYWTQDGKLVTFWD